MSEKINSNFALEEIRKKSIEKANEEKVVVPTEQQQNALLFALTGLLTAQENSLSSAIQQAKTLQITQSAQQKVAQSQNGVKYQGPSYWASHSKYYTLKNRMPSIGGWMSGFNTLSHAPPAPLAAYYNSHVKTKKIDANIYNTLNIQNQKIEADREYFSNQLILLQQSSQNTESSISMVANSSAQQQQEYTNFTSLLAAVTNQIGQVTKQS